MGERAQWPPHQVTTTPEPSDWLPRFREKLRGYEVRHVWYDEAPNFDPPEGFRGFPGRVGGRRAGRTAEAVRSASREATRSSSHTGSTGPCASSAGPSTSPPTTASGGPAFSAPRPSDGSLRRSIPEAADARVDCGWRPLTIEELTWPHPL